MTSDTVSLLLDRIGAAGPASLWALATASPLASAVVGAALAIGVVLVAARRGAERVAPSHGGFLSVVAAVVLAGWLADLVLRGYIVDMTDRIAWWRFAFPPLLAAIGLGTFALLPRASASPRRPNGLALTRRTWTTFAPRPVLLLGGGIGAAVAGAALACGLGSTSLNGGPAVYLRMTAPNSGVEPVFTWFPGWPYALPLLVALGVLTATVVVALRRDAVAVFPDDTDAESEIRSRRSTARGVVSVAAGAALLAGGGLLRMAGTSVGGVLTARGPGDGTRTVETVVAWADLLRAGSAVAPALEAAGAATLAGLVVWRLYLRAASAREHEEAVR